MNRKIYLRNTRANRSYALKVAKSRKKRHLKIMLMSMTPGIHTTTAVLDLPRGNADRGVEAGKIITKCTDNPFVPISDPEIADAITHWKAYNDATTSNRKARWRVVSNDLKGFMGKFQEAANLDPENAVEIIESGGFKVKKIAVPQNHKFEAKNSAISGRVDLTAEGGGAHTAHDWWFSADNVVWVRMTPTINANTFMLDLEAGKLAYFNHQLITKEGEGGLEGMISIMVM